MVGLAKGTVILVAHQTSWQTAFQREQTLLAENLGNDLLAVEHVGSTAVNGLAAKPIIDIIAAVKDRTSPHLLGTLQKMGYEFNSKRVFTDRTFLAKGPASRRTHHLSLVDGGSRQWQQTVQFRDLLRANKQVRLQYEQLKKQLARQHPTDYTAGKSSLIETLLLEEFSADH